MPQLYVILPVGGYDSGARPDQGLPGGQGGYPSQPIYHPGHPDHGLPPFPDQGLPPGGSGARPSQPIYHPGHPDHGLPAYPDQGLPPGAAGGGTEVPEDVYAPAPIPEEIASQYVVSVYNPKTMTWTTKSYPPR